MFLKIKNIPRVSWSSEKPLNLKPRISTFFFLCFGLSLFGIGEGLLLVSYTGASPWSVLAQGISLKVNFSIGAITFCISIFVISLWVFLNQKPGIGTILNAVIIAAMIDVCLNYVSTPESFAAKMILAVSAVLLVGIGSGKVILMDCWSQKTLTIANTSKYRNIKSKSARVTDVFTNINLISKTTAIIVLTKIIPRRPNCKYFTNSFILK